MTRDEAKALLGRTALLMFEHNGSSTLDGDKTLNIIDKIFDEHGEHLMDRDDEIELLKCRIEEAMKPKTCDGCVYGVFGVDSFGLEIECTLAYRCSRGQDDMFKPKVTP